MGLFGKKDPCAICGGKVKGLLPWKIDGQLICNDCYGHLPCPTTQSTICPFRISVAIWPSARRTGC